MFRIQEAIAMLKLLKDASRSKDDGTYVKNIQKESFDFVIDEAIEVIKILNKEN